MREGKTKKRNEQRKNDKNEEYVTIRHGKEETKERIRDERNKGRGKKKGNEHNVTERRKGERAERGAGTV